MLFHLLQRGFIHSLDVWNSWKVLVKNWLFTWWWSRTTLQIEQNRRLLSAWNFPGYCLARSYGLMLDSFFFGFTFKTNWSIFKAKTPERKLFCRQINQSRALFSFSKLWLVIFLPIMARVIWKTRAQVPTASSIEHLECPAIMMIYSGGIIHIFKPGLRCSSVLSIYEIGRQSLFTITHFFYF